MSPSEGFGAYTDYGRLKSAIVGSAEGLSLPPFNPTLHHYNEEVQAALKANGDQPLDIATAMPARWEKTVEHDQRGRVTTRLAAPLSDSRALPRYKVAADKP